jgi:hypothetical protein
MAAPSGSDPVGVADIARRLQVRRQTVAVWKRRGLLPAPQWTVSGQPAWDWPRIHDWANATGRLPDDLVIAWLTALCVGATSEEEILRVARVSRSVQLASVAGGAVQRQWMRLAQRPDLDVTQQRLRDVCITLTATPLGSLRDDSLDASKAILEALADSYLPAARRPRGQLVMQPARTDPK